MNIHLLFLLAFAYAAPSYLMPPSVDDFYQPPDGFEKAKPGDILRARKAPAAFKSAVGVFDVKNMWQLLVRSEGPTGNASVIATTIVEPYNANSSRVISYQVAQDSSSVNCAVSYAIQEGSPSFANSGAQAEVLVMQSFLNDGAYLVTSDYEGANASFSVGLQAGHGVLDSIKATLKSGNLTGIDPDAKVGLFGYSGGAIATTWASALQPDYAPELKKSIVGAAFGGSVPNITATALAIDQSIFSGFAVSAIIGLIQTYPQLDSLVTDEIENEGLRKFYLAEGNLCMVPSLFSYPYENIFSGEGHILKSGTDLFHQKDVAEIIKNNTLAVEKGLHMPEIPLYSYHGTYDQIAPVNEAVRIYENWCDWGIESFEMHVDYLSEHLIQVLAGTPSAIAWLRDRLNGIPPEKGCKKQTRITNFAIPGTIDGLSEMGGQIWNGILDKPIGPTNTTKRSVLESQTKKVLSDFMNILDLFTTTERR